jgi:ferredoxin
MTNKLNTELTNYLLPDIDASRCLYSISEQAQCDACITVCELQAWIIDDEQMHIDATKCDGCNLCAAACPQQAIENRCKTQIREIKKINVAFIQCARSKINNDEGQVVCVHAYSIVNILQDYKQGVRQLVVATGDCRKCCHHNVATYLQKNLQTVNELLIDAQSKPIKAYFLNHENWQNYYKKSLALSSKTINRRNFFKQLVEEAKDLSPTEQDKTKIINAGRLLPVVKPPQKLPFIFSLDYAKCNLCLVCINLCPQTVLDIHTVSHTQSLFSMEHRDCNGCNLCITVCDKDAITITKNKKAKGSIINLIAAKCEICGVPFYSFEQSKSQQTLCRICHQTNHRKLLHQVI